MNKIKLGVGLILIVLCVAVLGIGIYAAASSTSTITGTITVNGARPEVKISAYQGSYNPASPSTNMLGTSIEKRNGSSSIEIGSLTFNSNSHFYGVSGCRYGTIPIIIVVENHSFNEDLGMYFWKDANNGGDGTVDLDEDDCVEYDDILWGHHLYDSSSSGGYEVSEDILDVEYEFYKQVPCATDTNSNGVYDSGTDTPGWEVIRMYLRMRYFPDSDAFLSFNVTLNIEDYVSNYTDALKYQKVFTKVGVGDYVVQSGSTFMQPTAWGYDVYYIVLPYRTNLVVSGWYDDGDYGGYFDYSDSIYIDVVSLPRGCGVNSYAFLGCEDLDSVFLPYGCTSVGERAFYGCTSLQSIYFENSVVTLSAYAFAGCTSLQYLDIRTAASTWTWSPCVFKSCTGLQEVYIFATQINAGISLTSTSGYFNSCSSTMKLHIPSIRANNHTSYYGGTYWRYYASGSYYTPIADL